MIKNGTFTHSKKHNVRSSHVWEVFHQINDDKGDSVEDFYFCIK